MKQLKEHPGILLCITNKQFHYEKCAVHNRRHPLTSTWMTRPKRRCRFWLSAKQSVACASSLYHSFCLFFESCCPFFCFVSFEAHTPPGHMIPRIAWRGTWVRYEQWRCVQVYITIETERILYNALKKSWKLERIFVEEATGHCPVDIRFYSATHDRRVQMKGSVVDIHCAVRPMENWQCAKITVRKFWCNNVRYYRASKANQKWCTNIWQYK